MDARNADFFQKPHRRLNILTDQWVQVSPHRTQRPWQGKQETAVGGNGIPFDPGCYLCPGNTRASGSVNPAYNGTYVFDNDYSALLPEASDSHLQEASLLVGHSERGICRVVCFSHRHDLTLPEMPTNEIRAVVDTWVDQYCELGSLPWIRYVTIFENKGEVMGCSNPHPHGQVWAQASIPEEPLKELRTQQVYYDRHGRTLLGDYLRLELDKSERIVTQNEHFVVLVPFWAFWPYETLVVSRRPFARFTDMTGQERDGLADIIRRITIRYDNLFQVSFPYSSGFHPAPTDGQDHPEWHFHMHFYPPLLRSATVKKFSVGYEMLANAQRDITAEAAAAVLQGLSETHYRDPSRQGM